MHAVFSHLLFLYDLGHPFSLGCWFAVVTWVLCPVLLLFDSQGCVSARIDYVGAILSVISFDFDDPNICFCAMHFTY